MGARDARCEVRRVRDLRLDGWGDRDVARAARGLEVSGLRVVGGDPTAADPWSRIVQALAVAPTGGVLCGWAAALVHGVPGAFLDGTSDGTARVPVEFCVPRDVGRFNRRGIKVCYSTVPAEDVGQREGLRLTSPRRTALDLARWSVWPGRALAMLDLSARFGLIDRPAFAAYAGRLRGLHGLKLVRPHLAHISTRAESVYESELRHCWLQEGLPTVQVNQPVHDRRGRFVGRVDLLDVESGVGAEYQGFWHRIDGAETTDALRFARFARMNLSVAAVWATDFRDGTVGRRLREAAEGAVARDPRLDAWVCPAVDD